MSGQRHDQPSVAIALAQWSVDLVPDDADLALADCALLDTVAVGLAARNEPILQVAAVLPEEAQWARVMTRPPPARTKKPSRIPSGPKVAARPRSLV